MAQKILIEHLEVENPSTGESFTMANPDWKPTPEQRKNTEEDSSGNKSLRPLLTGDAIRVFLQGYPPMLKSPPSLEDSSYATEIFFALRAGEDGKIELDVKAYDWLIETFKKHGTSVFMLNGATILESFRRQRTITQLPRRSKKRASSA